MDEKFEATHPEAVIADLKRKLAANTIEIERLRAEVTRLQALAWKYSIEIKPNIISKRR